MDAFLPPEAYAHLLTSDAYAERGKWSQDHLQHMVFVSACQTTSPISTEPSSLSPTGRPKSFKKPQDTAIGTFVQRAYVFTLSGHCHRRETIVSFDGYLPGALDKQRAWRWYMTSLQAFVHLKGFRHDLRSCVHALHSRSTLILQTTQDVAEAVTYQSSA